MALPSGCERGKLWGVTLQVQKPAAIAVPGQRGPSLHLAGPPSLWCQSTVGLVAAAASLSIQLKQPFVFKA